jgi:hypothetical protein
MRIITAAIVIALMVCSAGGVGLSAEAANFSEFFAPTGDDGNPGSIEKQFCTIAHARDAVRSINQQMTGNVVVNLRVEPTLYARPSNSPSPIPARTASGHLPRL